MVVTASGNIFSSPLIADDKVIFGCHDNHVYCLHQSIGCVIWKAGLDSTVGCTPYPIKVRSVVPSDQLYS